MLRIGVAGLGKMGISHFSILNSDPGVEVVACDASRFVLSGIEKYTKARTYTDYDHMLADANLDAVVISTPSVSHGSMVRAALERGIHTFCEKPFCLDWRESQELATAAEAKGLTNQVGYHYRYVSTFAEAKRLVDANAIGEISHGLAEAYGPVVLRPKSSTWRTKRSAGGGCLYDYASHPINLVNWFFGLPAQISGSVLGQVFSTETEDEVYSTFHFDSGMSTHLSVNWSDESERKMSTRLTLFGAEGKIYVDRQEIRVFLRHDRRDLVGYSEGWNLKYTTELSHPVRFYLRGEEYTAQLDAFVSAVRGNKTPVVNPFRDALETDMTMALLTSQSIEKMRVQSLDLDTEAGTSRIIRAKAKRLLNLRRGLVAATEKSKWFRWR